MPQFLTQLGTKYRSVSDSVQRPILDLAKLLTANPDFFGNNKPQSGTDWTYPDLPLVFSDNPAMPVIWQYSDHMNATIHDIGCLFMSVFNGLSNVNALQYRSFVHFYVCALSGQFALGDIWIKSNHMVWRDMLVVPRLLDWYLGVGNSHVSTWDNLHINATYRKNFAEHVKAINGKPFYLCRVAPGYLLQRGSNLVTHYVLGHTFNGTHFLTFDPWSFNDAEASPDLIGPARHRPIFELSLKDVTRVHIVYVNEVLKERVPPTGNLLINSELVDNNLTVRLLALVKGLIDPLGLIGSELWGVAKAAFRSWLMDSNVTRKADFLLDSLSIVKKVDYFENSVKAIESTFDVIRNLR